MTLKERYETAIRKAMQALGTETEAKFYSLIRKMGVDFMYDGDEPLFDLQYRLDSYDVESLQPIWQWIRPEYRTYFDALVHEVDPETLSPEEMLTSVRMYQDFLSGQWDDIRIFLHMGAGYYMGDDTTTIRRRFMNGAALFRYGYRVSQTHAESTIHEIDLPKRHEREYIYETEERWSTEMGNPRHRLLGLYKIDGTDPSESRPVLNDVLTIREAAERFGVDAGTIRVSIHKGYIAARKSGGTWLIALEDAARRWGPTVMLLGSLLYLTLDAWLTLL